MRHLGRTREARCPKCPIPLQFVRKDSLVGIVCGGVVNYYRCLNDDCPVTYLKNLTGGFSGIPTTLEEVSEIEAKKGIIHEFFKEIFGDE